MNRERADPPKTDEELRKVADDIAGRYEPEPVLLLPANGPLDDEVAKELRRLRVRHLAEQALRTELTPTPELPQTLTLAERLAQPLPPIEWRLEGWQPTGTRGILSAAYKAGKTTLLGNLVRSLADGDPFLDVAETAPPGNIGVLDFEMSGRMLDRWYEDQDLAHPERVVVVPMRGNAAAFNLLNDRTRSRWVERLRQLEISYLLLDPLRPWLDALGLDEHNEAGLALQAFDQLLTEAGISEGLAAHHFGHGAERSRGDSRLRDWPDFEWRLVRQDDDPASPRYVSAYGRDIDVAESLLTYDPANRRLTLAGGSRKGAEVRSALDDIEEVLAAADEPLSGRKIEEALYSTDHSRLTIRKAVKKGVADGLIKVTAGPRNSTLHTLSAPVRRSAPPIVRRTGAVAAVSSAPPYIDGALPRTRPGGADTPDDQETSAAQSAAAQSAVNELEAAEAAFTDAGLLFASVLCAVCSKPGPDSYFEDEPVHARCRPGARKRKTSDERNDEAETPPALEELLFESEELPEPW